MATLASSQIAWLLVLAAGVNSCIGNLMLKKSQLEVSPDDGFFALLVSPWFLGGLAFYGVNVVLFAKALEKLAVSAAYPVLAGSGFALLVLSAAWLYGERLSTTQYLGIGAILLGVLLLARN